MPMATEAQFYAYSGAVLTLGPKSESPVSAQPGVRVRPSRAAVAYWRVVCVERAVPDDQWTPRKGVPWAGIKRSCVHLALQKSPWLLEDNHGLRSCAEASCARLRQAVGSSDLPPGCAGLSQMLEHAIVLRCAASARLAFFAVRRAFEIAGQRTSDVRVDEAGGAVELGARCQKNNQLGVGQRVHSSSWRGARRVQLTSG